MKNRSIVRSFSRRQLIKTKSTGAVVETWTFPSGDYDTFIVDIDYVGPKQLNVVHPHQFRKILYTDYRGTEMSETSNSYTDISGHTRVFTRHGAPGLGYAPATDFSTLYNNALSQVYDQIRGRVDAAVSLAELRQTQRMIGKVFRFVNYVRSFHPKKWASKWLEYQYGWKPLAQDAYNAFQQVMDFHTYSYVRVEGRAHGQRSGQARYPNTIFQGCTEVVSYDLQERVKVVAEFAMSNSSIQRLSGYTSLNPASIAWELMPYSFVVDWVYDIGGWIRNLESAALFHNDLKRAYYVQGYRCFYAGEMSGGGSQGSGVTSFANAKAEALYTYKLRNTTSLLPRAPSVKLDLGWQRLISAASLLSLHLGRK